MGGGTDKALDDLRGALGPDHILTGAEETAPYMHEPRGAFEGRALCVARPAAAGEVARVVGIARARGLHIVLQSGNTGLVGGQVPFDGARAILLSLGRLNRIRSVDAQNNVLVAEAGCILSDIQAAARGADRLFPLSLASEGSAQLGGLLAANAGGQAVLRYGSARDLTLGLEAVLADGSQISALSGLRKDNSGYDLKSLLVGSEGTLGVITAAALKLFARPRARAVFWAAVADPGAAVGLLRALQERFGESVSAFELIARAGLELILRHIPQTRDPLAGEGSAFYVLCALDSSRQADDLRAAAESFLNGEIEGGRIATAVAAASAAQAAQLWRLRESLPEAQKREGASLKHDVSVPVSRLPDFMARAAQAVRAALPGVRVIAFGHLGDGNIHFNLSQPKDMTAAAFLEQGERLAQIVYGIVLDLGGSVSAEHGIGVVKRAALLRQKSAGEMAAMRAIKRALDPDGIFNPGKIFEIV